MPMLPPRPQQADAGSLVRGPEWDALRYAALRSDVQARLREVCGGMAPDAFAQLVDDVCAMKLRWAASERVPGTQA